MSTSKNEGIFRFFKSFDAKLIADCFRVVISLKFYEN